MEPLKFRPLFRQTVWGGDKVVPFKKLDEQLENVGGSWEISSVKDNKTFISEGEYENHALNNVMRGSEGELVGEANYERFGDESPLLIRFIDARQDLSIQVHPTDEIVKKQGRSRGKTEV